MIYPPTLKKGDTIGMVCPAGFMAPERFQACVEQLHQWGYRVKLGKTMFSSSETYFSGTDEERLQDLQQMLDDKTISAILFGRGGYGVSRIIDRLDFRAFRKSPKWIIGFSDITLLHSHLNRTLKIATMHAPMAAAFNDGGYESPYVLSIRDSLAGKKMSYSCPPHDLNQEGKASGQLVGGNLALLVHAIGTASAYKLKGKILFIEDVGELLYNIDRMMLQLKRSGSLDGLSALIIGGFTENKDTERPFGRDVYEILKEYTASYKYPVCFGFPVSHEKENYALKVGARYLLNVGADKVTLKEK